MPAAHHPNEHWTWEPVDGYVRRRVGTRTRGQPGRPSDRPAADGRSGVRWTSMRRATVPAPIRSPTFGRLRSRWSTGWQSSHGQREDIDRLLQGGFSGGVDCLLEGSRLSVRWCRRGHRHIRQFRQASGGPRRGGCRRGCWSRSGDSRRCRWSSLNGTGGGHTGPREQRRCRDRLSTNRAAAQQDSRNSQRRHDHSASAAAASVPPMF